MSAIQTFSVNRKPFVAPRYLSVVRSEGFSTFGDAILALPLPSAVSEKENELASTAAASPVGKRKKRLEEDEAQGGGGSAAATAAAAGGGDGSTYVEGALVVRKYEALTSRPRALAAVTRMLTLQQQLPCTGSTSPIVPILDAYVESSRREDIYVVTPQYPTTLAALLVSGSTQLAAEQVLFIMHEVACAVQSLNRLGVVAGEIRPEAIFLIPHKLGCPGSVLLGDFSMCHHVSESLQDDLKYLDPSVGPPPPPTSVPLRALGEEDALRLTEVAVASPHACYRAPEWALELVGSVGYAADVWALGSLFIEMLTRRPLWASERCNAAEYIGRVSQLLGYPADDSYITNASAKALWKATSASWHPVGVASLLSMRPEDTHTRSMLLLAKKMLCLEPSRRMDIDDVLRHPLLRQFSGDRSGAQSPSASSPLRGTAGTLPGSPGALHHQGSAAEGGPKGFRAHNVTNGSDSPTVARSTAQGNAADPSWAVKVSDRPALLKALYGDCVRVLQ